MVGGVTPTTMALVLRCRPFRNFGNRWKDTHNAVRELSAMASVMNDPGWQAQDSTRCRCASCHVHCRFRKSARKLPQLAMVRNYAVKSTNLYDILQITPKASAAQVKSAYYKLSKRYHPDLNKGLDANFKFTEIARAYEVIGSPQKRHLYDRGLLDPSGTAGAQPTMDGAYEEFLRKKGQFAKRGPAPPTGKTRAYNFDEFYRQHYGDSVRNHAKAKREHADFMEQDDLVSKRKKRNAILYVLGLVSTVAAFVIRSKKWF